MFVVKFDSSGQGYGTTTVAPMTMHLVVHSVGMVTYLWLVDGFC